MTGSGGFYCYYVVFGPAGQDMPWWQRWAVRGREERFGHVEVMMQLGCDVLRMTMNGQGVWFNKYFDTEQAGRFVCAREVALGMVEAGHEVVEVWVRDSDRRILCLANMVPSCVTMVKAVLGRASWELTPWQLYNGLIRDGGSVMSFSSPKPDTSAMDEQAQLSKEKALKEGKKSKEAFLAMMAGRMGRRALITNLGGEQGTLGNG